MSSLADAVGGPETPHAAIVRMCGYISCDTTVAMHVNRLFGTSVKPSRVAALRKEKYRDKRWTLRGGGTGKDDETGLAEQGRWVAAARNGNKAFLDALAEGRR